MSTRRSVGRSAATLEKDRSAVTSEKDPGPVGVTREVDRFAVTPKKDRSSLCSFSFADGRRCRTPRCSAHPHFCYFHAKEEAKSLAASQVGRDISSFFSGSYLSACDLNSALSSVFSAVAQGQVKPKTASALAYLGQTILQSIHLAQDEYINAFGTDTWRGAIRSSFAPPSEGPDLKNDPDGDPDPQPLPAALSK